MLPGAACLALGHETRFRVATAAESEHCYLRSIRLLCDPREAAQIVRVGESLELVLNEPATVASAAANNVKFGSKHPVAVLQTLGIVQGGRFLYFLICSFDL